MDKELATGVDASKLGPFYGLPSSFKGESENRADVWAEWYSLLPLLVRDAREVALEPSESEGSSVSSLYLIVRFFS